MLDVASKVVARQAVPNLRAALLPDVGDLRYLSATVAEAVYHAAVEDDAVEIHNSSWRCSCQRGPSLSSPGSGDHTLTTVALMRTGPRPP
jgi:hypothetical protein